MTKNAFLTPLKQFVDERGSVKRIMRDGDSGFNGFAEVYCSTVNFKVIKGWKKHKKMTLNLCVLNGRVKFYIHNEDINETVIYEIGDNRYERLTVPPGLWVAFEGASKDSNIIINTADLIHDPDECETKELYQIGLES